MSKLRSEEEVWDELCKYGSNTLARFVSLIEADRDAVRQACADAHTRESAAQGINVDTHGYERQQAAILSAGKVDEKQERLGRVMFEGVSSTYSWDGASDDVKKIWRHTASVALAELEKMEGES